MLSSQIRGEDFILLKSGSLYGGEVVAKSSTAITLKVLAEYLTFERSEIEKMYYKDNTLDDKMRANTKKEKAEAAKKDKVLKDGKNIEKQKVKDEPEPKSEQNPEVQNVSKCFI